MVKQHLCYSILELNTGFQKSIILSLNVLLSSVNDPFALHKLLQEGNSVYVDSLLKMLQTR